MGEKAWMKSLMGVKQASFASAGGFCSPRITQRDSFDGANAEPQRIIEQQTVCHF